MYDAFLLPGNWHHFKSFKYCYDELNTQVDDDPMTINIVSLFMSCLDLSNCVRDLDIKQARPLLEEYAIEELIDPRLGSHYSEHEVSCMLHAASLCIRRDPYSRPRMSQVNCS